MTGVEDFIHSLVIQAPGFIFAIMCHEWAHAYVALKFGDDTAERAGRLTLNPVAHADPVGSVIWPLICLMMPGSFIFGYAKPVPVNSSRFSNYRSGLFWVSFAGPLMNIFLGITSAILYAFIATKVSSSFYLYGPFLQMLEASIYINFILAVFNLIPFPPLDGSRMVTSFLNYEQARQYEGLQRYALVFLLILWFSPIFEYLLYPAFYLGKILPGYFAYLMN